MKLIIIKEEWKKSTGGNSLCRNQLKCAKPSFFYRIFKKSQQQEDCKVDTEKNCNYFKADSPQSQNDFVKEFSWSTYL